MLGQPEQLPVAAVAPERITLICLLLFLGAVRQVGPVPAACVVAGRDGRPDAGQRAHSRGDDGDGRRVSGRPLHAAVRAVADGADDRSRGIGGITALLAALIALTQNDLKRVLAYSTVSQLGYMFMALGAGAAGGEVGHARRDGRHVPLVHARLLQGAVVSWRRAA